MTDFVLGSILIAILIVSLVLIDAALTRTKRLRKAASIGVAVKEEQWISALIPSAAEQTAHEDLVKANDLALAKY
jgi:hypothetical protein